MPHTSISTLFNKIPFGVILLIAFGVRFLPAYLLFDRSNYDLESYALVSRQVVLRHDVYTAKETLGRHPYLPLQMYWLGLARGISDSIHLPFPFVVKWLFILADLLIVVVIFLSLQKQTAISPVVGALLYSFHPIAIYVSAYHGQFDSLPMLFSLIALLLLTSNTYLSPFFLGLGIWVKSWPVLALPAAMLAQQNWMRRFFYLLIVGMMPLAGILIYIGFINANWKMVLLRALGYNHGFGVWGYTFLIRLLVLWLGKGAALLNNYRAFGRFVTILAIGFVWFRVSRSEKNPIRLYLITLLSFLAFTHAFSIQYLVWVLPFSILNFQSEHIWLRRYLIASFAYCFLVYNTLILRPAITNLLPWPQADIAIIIPASLPVWLVVVFWMIDLIKRSGENEKITAL